MPSLEELQRKLRDIQQEVRNLTVMAMRPDLSPQKREVIKHLERSARAELKLRQKALDYAVSNKGV